MPRKKTKATIKTKGKKTAPAKRQTKSPSLMLAENIEKDFRYVPSKLVALYKKDLAILKVKEKKLQADLKKVKTQKKTTKDKHTALVAKSKTSPAAKKQMVTTQKSLNSHDDTLQKLITALDQLKQHSRALTQKQTKFTTLGKQLLKIEKELDLQAKESAATKTTKKATKKTTATPSKQPNKSQPSLEKNEQTQDLTTSVSDNELAEIDS